MAETWKDVSSYSQRETNRTPKSFELRAGWLRLTVTRWVHGEPDRWYGSCHEASVNNIDLGTDLEQAKAVLIGTVLGMHYAAVAELEAALETSPSEPRDAE